MKALYKIIIGLIIMLGFTACTDYLDVVPDNVATIEYSFRNRHVAEKFLFTCYSYRPSFGDFNGDPAINGADECWEQYRIYEPWAATNIQRGWQNPQNPYLNFWDGINGARNLWQGIRDCNIFLENIDKVKDLEDSEKTRWIGEAKFLKAFYHFYLFKCYGPIPIMDVNIPVSAQPEEVRVYREPVETVVDYIVDLLEEAYTELPNPDMVITGTEAGRVDKLVALTVKADVLLLAASPLFNGNKDYAYMVDNRGVNLFPQTYDLNKWELAAEACKEAIDVCHESGKELYDQVDPLVLNAPEAFYPQMKYREAIADPWNKELIWGGTNHSSYNLTIYSMSPVVLLNTTVYYTARPVWAPLLKTVEIYYSSNGVPIDEDTQWANNSWYENRFKVRPEVASGDEIYYVKEGQKTIYLHFNREARFYGSLGFDKGIYYGNGYYKFPDNVKYCDFFADGVSGGVSHTGYNVKKMHSFKNAQTYSSSSQEYFPFPIYRLADLYLMYAEASNEAYGPNDDVFTYLDLVRARVGLEGVKESWLKYSTRPDKPNTKDGMREIIHRERRIEFTFESKRYWDVRRWKEINSLDTDIQGWDTSKKTHEEFYIVTDKAQDPVTWSIKDYFMPIREYNLNVNSNLIQNYGW